MDEILELTKIDFISLFISVFVILLGMKSAVSIFEWITKKLGLETKWMRKKREEHELLLQTRQSLEVLQKKHEESVRQSIRHDEMIKNDISSLTETVNGIVITLDTMQQKNNETKLKELKDSLIRYYNKYRNTGEWSRLEKDAFWDLFNDYESRGGDGYIHSIVEPIMRELKEID